MLNTINTGRRTLYFFIIVGALWYVLTKFLPENNLRNTIIIIFTFIFCGVFMWSLFSTLKRVFGNKGPLWKELILTVFNVLIFLLIFSAIYSQIGIVDLTIEGNPITYEYWSCLYYSVITFTSTGYGDFRPQGIGRVLASVHALVGYLVLGLMASTSMSVIQWSAEGSGVTRGIEKEKDVADDMTKELDDIKMKS